MERGCERDSEAAIRVESSDWMGYGFECGSEAEQVAIWVEAPDWMEYGCEYDLEVLAVRSPWCQLQPSMVAMKGE